MIVRASLPEEQFAMMSASDGLAAIRILGSPDPVDLVLLDLGMPGLDGFGVLADMRAGKLRASDSSDPPPDASSATLAAHDMANLRAQKRGEHVPVIVLTGRRNVEDVERADKYRIAGYLVKPIEPALLLERVNAALARPMHETG